MFSAELRLSDKISKAEKAQRVQDVIDELGLSKVADSKVCAMPPSPPGSWGGMGERQAVGAWTLTIAVSSRTGWDRVHQGRQRRRAQTCQHWHGADYVSVSAVLRRANIGP